MNELVSKITQLPIFDYTTLAGQIFFNVGGFIGMCLFFYLMWYEVKELKKDDK